MYNFMAAVVDHSLLFSDAFGGVQRLHLANGTALWSLPALSEDQMSTGGEIYWEKLKVAPQKTKAPRNHWSKGHWVIRCRNLQRLVAFQVDKKSWA